MRKPFLAVAALLLLAAPALAATGGPDALGWYTWADSDQPGVDPTPQPYAATDLRPLGYTGDDSLLRVDLPTSVFPDGFEMYGVAYRSLWLSTNGWLTFVDPLGDSAPGSAGLPTPGVPEPTIAWFWDDLNVDVSAPVANAGANDAGDSWTFFTRFWSASTPGNLAQAYVILYTDGRIKLIWVGNLAANLSIDTTIGLENEAGDVGLPYMVNGVAQGGANFRSNYAVEFTPAKGSLSCATATPAACPAGTTAFDNLSGSNEVRGYSCAAGIFDGNERVFSIDLSDASSLDVTLTNTDGRDRRLFLLRATCANQGGGCISGGATTLQQAFLGPGRYHVVVDGVTTADNGNFTLGFQCAPAGIPATCNTVLTSESTSGLSILTDWDCAGTLGGPEQVYRVDVGAGPPTTLTARLNNASDPALQVLISDATGLDPVNPTCLEGGADVAARFNAQGTYFVTVDAPAGVSGTYDLEIDCGQTLACAAASPIDVTNPTPIAGDTSTSSNITDAYYCTESGFRSVGAVDRFTGPEDIYEFTLTATRSVGFFFEAADPDLRMLLIGDCYEGACVQEGGCGENLPPGTYRLVVDGLDGASGPYTVTPFVQPVAPYQRWTDCPVECTGGCDQEPEDVGLQRFGFDSENYCGTGCDFSLFAVVECGSSFHIPLYDVETGHMEIVDILTGLNVDLTATNDVPSLPPPPGCEHTDTGTHVSWEDNTCTAIPCPPADCMGGTDCRTTDVIMDVSFQGTPLVCGIYRLDFLTWGGREWEVYANCSQDRRPQFFLYRDFCSALANYKPSPEGGIADVTVSEVRCASLEATGQITVENLGCLPADDIEIVIDTVPSTTPTVYTVDLLPAEQRVIDWSYTVPAPDTTIEIVVDPANKTAECSEATGTPVGCGISGGLVRTFTTSVCPDRCYTQAAAGANVEICEGSSHTLDGGASFFACRTGTPEYRWEDGIGTAVCDWSTDPTCLRPAATLFPGFHLFTLKTRCEGETPTCETESNVVIEVLENVTPDGIGNVVRAVRANDSAVFSWAAILGPEISGYRVYRSDQPAVFPTRSNIGETALQTFEDTDAILLPPQPIGYYQFVGLSCLGDLEGPY